MHVSRGISSQLVLLGDLLEGIPAPSAIALDPAGSEIRVNGAFDDLLGIARGTYRALHTGGPFPYRFEADGRTLSSQDLPLMRALRGEQVDGMRIEVFRADQEVRSIIGFATAVRDSDGTIVGAFCIFQDIGREVAALEQLAASERRYRELASLTPGLLFTADADGNTDFVNARWAEVTGVAADAMHGEGWMTFVHPDEKKRVIDSWWSAMRTGNPYREQFRVRRVDGTYHWVEARAEPAFAPNGRIVRWFGSGADIDDQRRALDVIRLLLDSGPQLAADVDIPTMLRGIAQTALAGLADVAIIDVLPDGDGEADRIVVGGPSFDAMWSAKVRGINLPPTDCETHPGVRAVAEDRPVVVPFSDDEWMRRHAPDDDFLDVWREIGFHSLLAVPLHSSGRAIGSMMLLRTTTPSPFDETDVRIAAEMGRRAGVAVEKARLARAQEQQFRRFADEMPQMMWAADAEGCLTWYNQRWYEYTAQSVEESLAEGWGLVLHPQDVGPVADRWNACVRSGETFEVELQIRGRDGSFRWFLTRARPLRDQSGRVRAWIGTSTDVDDARRAERTLAVFARVGEMLSESLGLEATLDAVLQVIVPAYADWAFVDLADESGDLRVAAVLHEDPTKRAMLREQVGAVYARRSKRNGSPLALRSRDPVLFAGEDLPLAMAGVEPKVLAAFRNAGLSALLVLPLKVGGSVRGALTLVMDDRSQRCFDRGELWFFEELTRRIAPAIANAELYERELRVARTFQEAALPASLPVAPGYAFDAIYEAGRSEALVGGDWYDAFRLADGRIVVSIGDVAGSGLQAAVTMANVRQAIRGVAQVHADPALMLEAADAALRAEAPDRFVTAFVAVIEPVVRTLTYASAGHPTPYLRTADGEILALRAEGLPLGLRIGGDAETVTVALERDSLLVLYTDGLIEATRDVNAGEALLQNAIAHLDARKAEHPAQAIHDAVLGAGLSGDDVAILTVAVLDDPIAAQWSFDARDPAAASAARRAFVTTLREAGYPEERVSAAETILGELIANAVRYAPGPVDVMLAWDDRHPVLHVLDRGPGFQFVAKLPSDLYSESGRGLFLITALAEAFHVTRRVEGGSHARVVLRPPTPLFADQATG